MVLEVNKQTLKESLLNGVRYDGRKPDEYRKIEIQPDFVHKAAEGSALVKVGKTKVLVGVKAKIEKPYPDRAKEGMLMVNAELGPMASPDFETGPPSETSIELARVVDRGIRESRMIDMEKLCIEEGEKVWGVFIDLHMLDNDGSLLDACALGAVTALQGSKLPEIDKKTGELNRDVKKTVLPLTDVPISVTVHAIGDTLLVDPTADEEEVSEARLTFAINKKGNVIAMQKGGARSLSIKVIEKMTTLAVKKSKELRKLMEKTLK